MAQVASVLVSCMMESWQEYCHSVFNNVFFLIVYFSLVDFDNTVIVFCVVCNACELFTVINKDIMWISQ